MGLCREIATFDPVAITECLGSRLTFEQDYDDLDVFSAAIFTIDTVYFALQLHRGSPTGHFTLITMENPAGDQASVERFLSWSGVPDSAVLWTRPGNMEWPF